MFPVSALVNLMKFTPHPPLEKMHVNLFIFMTQPHEATNLLMFKEMEETQN